MQTSGKPTLRGSRVVLRPPTREDAVWRQRLGYDPEIVRMFGGEVDDRTMTIDAAVRWVNELIADSHAWIIEVDRQGIGEVRLHHVNSADQTASLAIGILDPERIGRGFGRESISLLARHAFVDLNLYRLSVRVLAFNRRAMLCYQACGFVIEGRERQSCRIGAERHDDVIMGVLAEEFHKAMAGSQHSASTNSI